MDAVLIETARVLQPGAPFIFCVPNHKFLPSLSVGRALDRIGLSRMGDAYRSFFNRISRHQHCDDPHTWEARLTKAGFQLETYWHYFSPAALKMLEWGHYWGVPSLVGKKLTGRWILSPTKWNLAVTQRLTRPYYDEPLAAQDGAYTFFIARRF